ncbi:Six-hairpin glycosidase-like protein [Entophlyctis helioformis]|nr:Six-hairpin glycosidase-like protein [Entophlyctis helioformis]
MTAAMTAATTAATARARHRRPLRRALSLLPVALLLVCLLLVCLAALLAAQQHQHQHEHRLCHHTSQSPTSPAQSLRSLLPSLPPHVEATLARTAQTVLFANLHAPGVPRGTAIASPSQHQPDYFFHWTRDAALAFAAVLDHLRDVTAPNRTGPPPPASAPATTAHGVACEPHPELEGLLDAYAGVSHSHQLRRDAIAGLGEPKFNVDGSPFAGPWGRPQTDGPALRASTLVAYAEHLLDTCPQREPYVRSVLYDGKLPSFSVVKTDLEYVAQVWRAPSFDLWEESLGTHWYTMAVQRAAMRAGARLARRLGDAGAANWYDRQAVEMEAGLTRFWDPAAAYIRATVDVRGGIESKASQLDVAVLLGAIHSQWVAKANDDDGDVHAPWNDRVMATVVRLVSVMDALYQINRNDSASDVAVVVGRYPEDVYDGIGFSLGNPWPLATAALAEQAYQIASHWCRLRVIPISRWSRPFLARFVKTDAAVLAQPTVIASDDGLFAAMVRNLTAYGDSVLLRIGELGSRPREPDVMDPLSEQWNRDSGRKQGAAQLTWSSVAVLQALRQRRRVHVDTCHEYLSK